MNIDDKLLKKADITSLVLREKYSKYGYKQYRMQKFEEVGLYLENKDFLESSQIITFNDLDGKLLALKPDVTLSIAKNISDSIEGVEKLFYIESVYRVKSEVNKYQEIKQMGLEAIGDLDEYCVVEVIDLALETLKTVDKDFVLDISHLGYITGMLEYLGLGYKASKKIQNCITNKNASEAESILRASGCGEDKIAVLTKVISLEGNAKEVLIQSEKLVKNETMQKAVDEMKDLLSNFGDSKNIQIDYSIINNSKYYNGIVFQGFVSQIPQVFLLGGSYGNLFRVFSKKYSAIGFAINLDLLDQFYAKSSSSVYDVLLIYKDSKPEVVKNAVAKFREKGLSVLAQKNEAGKIKYIDKYIIENNELRSVKC